MVWLLDLFWLSFSTNQKRQFTICFCTHAITLHHQPLVGFLLFSDPSLRIMLNILNILSFFYTLARLYPLLRCSLNDPSILTPLQNPAGSLHALCPLWTFLNPHTCTFNTPHWGLSFNLSVSLTRSWAHKRLMPGLMHFSCPEWIWLWIHPTLYMWILPNISDLL